MKKKKSTPPVTELRLKAELKLKERKKKTAPPTAREKDSLRLIHELEVHQIELEMQNEQLLQSQAELESTLSMYAELYAFAPAGYFTLTREGMIRRSNLTGAKLLNRSISELINQRFEFFVELPSRATFRVFLERVFMNENKETCEVALKRDGMAPLWVHIEGITNLNSGEGNLCYAIVSDVTERRQAEDELRRLSTHDPLTGLYNHGFFMAAMERLERGREFPVSIVMADVDHLKQTNDQYGHAAGDELLKHVAQALLKAFRSEDVVARIGGDEFAILLPVTNARAAHVSLQRVRQIIHEHNTDQAGIPLHISLGVATAEEPGRLSAALKEADAEMYRDKRSHNEI